MRRSRHHELLVTERTTLRELALVFPRLGATAFGGPAAHIAMMEEEVVRRRKWLTREEFLDLIGMTNLIPGPNSTEMAIHIGHRRAGWPGLLVAGASFILPAAVIVLVIAWAYQRFRTLPRRGERSARAPASSLENGRCLPRRRERRFLGADGDRHMAPGSRGDR